MCENVKEDKEKEKNGERERRYSMCNNVEEDGGSEQDRNISEFDKKKKHTHRERKRE